MDVDQLRRAILYDPESGTMTWRAKSGADREARRWNARYAGRPALSTADDQGYLTGTFNRKHMKAHRVAWAIFYSRWPEAEIDHINGNTGDNRVSNLREATRTQNAQNTAKRKGGLSRYRGVSRDGKKWRAIINANGMRLNLGSFDNEKKAAIAYDLAAPVMHGEFARPNFVHDRDAVTAFIEAYVAKHHRTAPIDGVKTYTEKEAF